jgi:hypothetical protein
MLSILFLHNSYCICLFSLWHVLVFICSIFYFTIDVISSDPFLKLTLCMFWIVISCKITSPFKDHNVTYMLCILSCILSGGWWKAMTKCSNVCPCILKVVKQKVGANGSWYQLILKVLKVFDSCTKWWYWKFLVMGAIDITFLGTPLRIMSCKVLWFYMTSLKSIKTLTGGWINSSYWIQCDFVSVIFWT